MKKIAKFFKKLFKKYMLAGFSLKFFKEQKLKIAESNIMILLKIDLGFSLVYSVLLVLSLCFPFFYEIRLYCIIATSISWLFMPAILTLKRKFMVYTRYLLSAFMIFIFAISMYMGFINTSAPSKYASIFLVVLVVLPALFVYPPWKSYFISTVSVFLFCVLSLIYKPIEIFKVNFVTSLCCYAFSLIVTFIMQEKHLNLINNFIALEKKKDIDSLTGLPNKYFFESNLTYNKNNEVKIGSVAMIDIDNFKKYNDKYGHLQGDEALKKMAKIFAEVTKKYHIPIIRFGGEEFLVIENVLIPHKFHFVLEELRKNIEKNVISNIENDKPTDILTISVGYCKHVYGNANLEELIVKADKALYSSKMNGKNQITRYADNIEMDFCDYSQTDNKNSLKAV